MKCKKRLQCFAISTFAALLSAISVFAQQAIKGTLRSSSGEPLAGATITVKGTNKSVITDANGHFTINAPAASTLLLSSVGFTEKEVTVSGAEINEVLQIANSSLNEVVVVGYGTQQRKDLTGAISVVKPTDIQRRQATTVAEAMQGLATGVNIRGGGQPGSEARIQIRGLKNMTNSNPLYVIDGLITTANRDFNPNDIESLQI